MSRSTERRVQSDRMNYEPSRTPALCIEGRRYNKVCGTCGAAFISKVWNKKDCDGCSRSVKFYGRSVGQ